VPAPPARVLAALVRGGIVDAASACAGDVVLVDASRSNPVFVVSVAGEPRHVVKQEGPAVDGGSSIDVEASAYRWLAAEPSLAAVAPRAVSYAPWLVLDAVPDGRPLHSLVTTLDGDLATLLGELAQVLAQLHTVSAASGSARSMLAERRPWVLELGSSRPGFADSNPYAGAAVARVQADAELIRLVGDGADAWQPSAAIHGDVKWDNVLVAGERLCLIDWELAAWGDPLWDVASIVESLLTTAALADDSADVAAVAPLARAAVAAYGPIPDADRLVRFVAARLVQVTIQLAGMTQEADSENGRRLLGLARALGGDPVAWRRELVG
jgi:aminoglycoside phosphotransferase (APT) family kinase protein